MGHCVGPYGFEIGMLRQTFECPPSREDQARFASCIALEDLGRGYPFRARTFALHDARLPRPIRTVRDEEQRVETTHRVEFGYPSREGRQRAGVDAQSGTP